MKHQGKLLYATFLWAVIASCFAVKAHLTDPPTSGLTEKEGWLSAPALLPKTALLKTSPVEAKVYILATRVKKGVQ